MPLEHLHDKEGKCIAFCDWTLCDEQGNVKNNGKFIYIYDIWCYKRNGSIPKFIKIIDKKAPNAKFVYWRHTKRKRFKMYLRKRFDKYLTKEE